MNSEKSLIHLTSLYSSELLVGTPKKSHAKPLNYKCHICQKSKTQLIIKYG